MWVDYLSILIIPLAAWRVSNLFADTDQSGPFGVLDWIRARAGVHYDEHSRPFVKEGSFAELLTCVYCNSIWIGLILSIGLIINIRLTIIASLPFALSASAIIIEEWRNWKKG